eukprot:5933103-Amphidinium_carterae.1
MGSSGLHSNVCGQAFAKVNFASQTTGIASTSRMGSNDRILALIKRTARTMFVSRDAFANLQELTGMSWNGIRVLYCQHT